MTPAGNSFKAALKSGKPQIGLWLSMASPYMAEVSATAGFDWLLIDGEHSPNNLQTTLAALQAIAAYPSHPIVRVVEGSEALIKQVLDIGAQTILMPMVDTAAQAVHMALAKKLSPQG